MKIIIGDGSGNLDYRTCAECGLDCMPDPFSSCGDGMRIAFVCSNCGIHTVMDPFEQLR